MAIADQIAADLAQLETEIPQVISWNGADYPCNLGSARANKTLESGRYGLDADLVVFVRFALFATNRPTSKQKLTFNAKVYLIDDVLTPNGQPFLKLVCSDPNKNL